MNISQRLNALEKAGEGARRLAYVRISGDVSALSDAELNMLIADLDTEIGPENAARMMGLSDAELEALASGAKMYIGIGPDDWDQEGA